MIQEKSACKIVSKNFNESLFDKLDASVIDPLKTLERRICPVPAEQVRDKLKYFFGPYNYAINTDRYMTFNGKDSCFDGKPKLVSL